MTIGVRDGGEEKGIEREEKRRILKERGEIGGSVGLERASDRERERKREREREIKRLKRERQTHRQRRSGEREMS